MESSQSLLVKGSREKGNRTRVLGDFYVERFIARDIRLLVVADGQGHPQALAAAEQLTLVLSDTLRTAVAMGQDFSEALTRGFQKANETLYHLFRQGEPSHSEGDLGLSCVCGVVSGNDLILAHVGDCRCYLFRKGRMMLRTQDHTQASVLVEKLTIAPQDAATNPGRYIPSRLIGATGTLDPEVRKQPIPLHAGDLLLLCTDGVHDVLDEGRIVRITQSTTPMMIPDRLIEECGLVGQGDDATALLAALEPEDVVRGASKTALAPAARVNRDETEALSPNLTDGHATELFAPVPISRPFPATKPESFRPDHLEGSREAAPLAPSEHGTGPATSRDEEAPNSPAPDTGEMWPSQAEYPGDGEGDDSVTSEVPELQGDENSLVQKKPLLTPFLKEILFWALAGSILVGAGVAYMLASGPDEEETDTIQLKTPTKRPERDSGRVPPNDVVSYDVVEDTSDTSDPVDHDDQEVIGRSKDVESRKCPPSKCTGGCSKGIFCCPPTCIPDPGTVFCKEHGVPESKDCLAFVECRKALEDADTKVKEALAKESLSDCKSAYGRVAGICSPSSAVAARACRKELEPRLAAKERKCDDLERELKKRERERACVNAKSSVVKDPGGLTTVVECNDAKEKWGSAKNVCALAQMPGPLAADDPKARCEQITRCDATVVAYARHVDAIASKSYDVRQAACQNETPHNTATKDCMFLGSSAYYPTRIADLKKKKESLCNTPPDLCGMCAKDLAMEASGAIVLQEEQCKKKLKAFFKKNAKCRTCPLWEQTQQKHKCPEDIFVPSVGVPTVIPPEIKTVPSGGKEGVKSPEDKSDTNTIPVEPKAEEPLVL